MSIYDPDPVVAALLTKAAETNDRRDAMDRAAGFATPSEGPVLIQLQTIQEALSAGMRMKDWDCIAEAVMMLRKTEKVVAESCLY